MPVLNEERHLAHAVTGILTQDWQGPLEIVLALGPSSDRTDEVARRLSAVDDRIVLVPNPTGHTPSGLNAAVHASRYEVVIRVDGHAILPGNYVSTAVETLARTGADNVGGIMQAEGESPFEQAVARAMTTPMGVGAAPFHVGGGEGEAETVYLGCFRKSALQRVGGYDETFLRAQDWEMNHRIRETGGLVWFNPALVVTYRPRPDAVLAGRPVLPLRPVAPRGHAPAPGDCVANLGAALLRPSCGGRRRRCGNRRGAGRVHHGSARPAHRMARTRGLRRPDHGGGGGGGSRPASGGARPVAAGVRHHARRVGHRLPDLASRTARARGVRALVRPGAAGPDAVAVVVQRLARLGVPDAVVIADGDCPSQLSALADGLSGRTLIVDADLIVADASLGQLVDDPAVRSGALVGEVGPAGGNPAGDRDDLVHDDHEIGGGAWPPDGDRVTVATGASGAAAPVRVAQKRIASAGSAVHDVSAPNAESLGALVIDARDVPAATAALIGAAAAARAHGWRADPIDVALVALVRAQVAMAAVTSVGPVLRGGTPEERVAAQQELAGIDEARVLLERANRPDDGFYSTFVLRRASKPLTALALRLHLTPNQVSVFSLGVGLVAALSFATGSWWGLLAGAVLMQASLIIDCVDGEVARFTRSFSDLGAWIDASTDRIKEYAAYAGLAAGSMRTGHDIWLLAALVMIMQTVRHVGDYDFSRVQRIRESWVAARPIEDPGDGGAAGSGATLELSAQLNLNSRVRWGKKVLHMPIGERWLVLSVGAITIGPRWTLWLMLGLGLLALAYTTVGRILRARTWRQPPDRSGAWLLEPQLDLGPIGQPLWDRAFAGRQPLAHAFGWALPAGMRVIELGIVWAGCGSDRAR